MNLSETTQKEQVQQADIAGVNSIWNSFFERILKNEEVLKNNGISSRETDSSDITLNDPSVNISINIKRSNN